MASNDLQQDTAGPNDMHQDAEGPNALGFVLAQLGPQLPPDATEVPVQSGAKDPQPTEDQQIPDEAPAPPSETMEETLQSFQNDIHLARMVINAREIQIHELQAEVTALTETTRNERTRRHKTEDVLATTEDDIASLKVWPTRAWENMVEMIIALRRQMLAQGTTRLEAGEILHIQSTAKSP